MAQPFRRFLLPLLLSLPLLTRSTVAVSPCTILTVGWSQLFAVLNSSNCAESICYGPQTVVSTQTAAYFSTVGRNTQHRNWLQVVHGGGQELFRVHYEFRNSKTLAERIANAVANGEEVAYQVCDRANEDVSISFRGSWRLSSNARISTGQLSGSGCRFSVDDGLWGAGQGVIDGDNAIIPPSTFWGVGMTTALLAEQQQCSLVYRQGQAIAYNDMVTYLYLFTPPASSTPSTTPSASPTSSNPSKSPTLPPSAFPTQPVPTQTPSLRPSVIPSPAPTFAYVNYEGFTFTLDSSDGVHWIKVLEKKNFDMFNPGQAIVNQLIHTNGNGILKYVIDGVDYNFYRRLRAVDSFDYYSNIANTWSSFHNVLNHDFEMYSLYFDLTAKVRRWQYCSYDEIGVGYPGYCGPVSKQLGKWTHFHRSELPYFLDGQQMVELWAMVVDPTLSRSYRPSSSPTQRPSLLPSATPSHCPSDQPTSTPTSLPTKGLNSYFCAESINNNVDLYCQVNQTNEGQKRCFPGLSFIGLGYDHVTQGMKSRVIDYPVDQLVPGSSDQMYLTSSWVREEEVRVLEETSEVQSSAYSSVSNYQGKQRAIYGIDSMFSSLAPSRVSKLRKTLSDAIGISTKLTADMYSAIEQSRSFVVHQTVAEMTKVEFVAPTVGVFCARSFFDAAHSLSAQGRCNAAAFDALIANYGSFVIVGGTYGGMIRSETSSYACSYSSAAEWNAALTATYKQLASFNVKASGKSTKVFSNSIERSSQVVEGGDVKAYKSAGFTSWYESIENGRYLAPISLQLLPISDLFPTPFGRECAVQAMQRYSQSARGRVCKEQKGRTLCENINVSESVPNCENWKSSADWSPSLRAIKALSILASIGTSMFLACVVF